ncbi:MAG: DUF998 domain-containing protein [Planctomycetota bacterium]
MITLAVLYLVAVLALAHLLAPREYSWVRKTVSSLAAQKYGWKKVLQAGFIGFGLLFSGSLFVGQPFLEGSVHGAVAFYSFSLCMILVGVFCTRPMEEVEYSRAEAHLHNAFSLLAGLSFFAGVVSFAISEACAGERALHIAAAGLFAPLSLGFFLIKPVKGLFLRGLYLIGFTWLLVMDNGLF